MQRISICGLKSDRKLIMELLQRKGLIEIQDFVAQLKKKKRRGFFARIFAALTGRD